MSNITVTSGVSTSEVLKAQVVEAPEKENKSASADMQDENIKDSETLEAETTEQDSDVESKPSDEEGKDENKGIRKKINKMTKKLSDKDREIEQLRARLSMQNQGKNQASHQESEEPKVETQKQNAEANGKPIAPRMSDFESLEDYEASRDEYQEKLADWKYDQRETTKAKQSAEEKAKSEFLTKIQEFQKDHPDFEDTIIKADSKVQTLFHVQEAIRNSDVPAAVMYELAKNTSEIERINKLTFAQAAIEIGKIEFRLSQETSEESKEVEQPKQKITKAPAPIAPIGKGSAPIKKTIFDPDLPFAEYEKLRREQIKAKNG